MIYGIAGLLVGAMIGFVACAMLSAGKQADAFTEQKYLCKICREVER